MGRVVLSENFRAILHGYDKPIELCDETGTTIGYFMPFNSKAEGRPPKQEVPFNDEELEQFRKAGGGGPLAEFWQRMKQS